MARSRGKITGLSLLLKRIIIGIMITVAALGGLSPARPALAAPSLTIAPVTWNVIGLDSNNVNVGPSNFPIGARVCNTGDAAANVTASFVFDDGADLYTGSNYINLRSGSLSSLSLPNLAAGTPAAPTCHDFFFEVSVSRRSDAYNKTRRYHIQVNIGGAPAVVTSKPRELYVERLVSQSRNDVSKIQLDGADLVNNTMNLTVGETYNITLIGSTATNGYNQLESFINLTNTIFQINSVTSTYGVTSLSPPYDRLYADSCGWDNNPLSPTYRSCILSDGKTGGAVTNTFNVTVLGGKTGTETLTSLLYDFSGSSYHYNADFTASSVIVNIHNAVSFGKSFSPASIPAGQISTLTFTISNPSLTNAVEDLDFDDSLQGGLVVAPGPVTSTTCGGLVTAAAGGTSITFNDGSLAANASCAVQVAVTAPANGAYPNTSGNLFVNGVDTGQSASAVLTVEEQSVVSLCGQTLARWSMDAGTSSSMPVYTVKASNVSTALATISSGLSTNAIDGSSGKPAAPSWQVGGGGFGTSATLDPLVDKFILFQVDTRAYYNISLSFNHARSASGPTKLAVYYATSPGGTRTSKTGASPFTVATSWTSSPSTVDFSSGETNAAGDTYFYLYPYQAGNNGTQSVINIDEVILTGCRTPQTMSKAFSPNPIPAGGTSTLTFNLANTSGAAYTGVRFSDTLPDGLTVADGPVTSNTCGGAFTAPAGGTSLSLTGGVINANSTCSASVLVKSAGGGEYHNVSSFITSAEGGTNSTSTGFGSATLTALLPPTFTKKFSPNPVYAGGSSTLTFTLGNPNSTSLGLDSPAFTDTLPAGLVIAPGPVTANTCGGSLTADIPTGVISLSGGAIPANGTCTISVDVTAAAVNNYANDAGVLTTSVVGLTSSPGTAADTLAVIQHYPGISLSKQVAPAASGPWTSFAKIAPGNDVYYRLTVENTGDVDLTGVKVSDPTLDLAGCPALTTPFTLTTADPIRTCDIGPLAADSGSFQNTAAARGSYGGTTYFDSSTAEYLGVSAAPPGMPGISLVKQVGPAPDGPWTSSLSTSGDVYYKFVVANTGTGDLAGISVVDPLVSTAACEWYDPLPEGRSTFCVVGPIASSPGSVTNTAHAEAATPAVISADASAAYISGSYSISGVVWHDDNRDGLTAGENGLFSVLLGLYNDADASGTYSPGVDNLISSQYTAEDGAYAFTGLPAGSYILKVNGTVSGYTLVSASDTLAFPSLSADSGGNNIGYDTAEAAQPDLTLAKSNSTGSAGSTGTPFAWNLTVSNGGAAAASFTSGQRILSDPLPAGASYGSPTADASGITGGVTCAVEGSAPGTLNCYASAGGVSVGAGQSLSVNLPANASTAGSLANTASADPDSLVAESNEGNNSGSDTVTVTDPPTPTPTFTPTHTSVPLLPDLTLSKTDSAGGAVTIGEDFTWNLSLSNGGTGPADFTGGQLVLNDPLPAGADYSGLSVDTSGVTGLLNCGVAGGPPGTLECRADGPLSIGAGQSLAVSFNVHTTSAGSLDNTASADPDLQVGESDEGNNSGSSSVVVSDLPTDTPTPTPTFTPTYTFTPTDTSVPGTVDLVVAKTDNAGGAGTVGVDFTWTLTVSNNGSLPAGFTDGQRVLTDPLPAGADYSGLVFDTSGITGSLICGVTGGSPGTLDCTADGDLTIAGGQSLAVSYNARPSASGSLDNTASVDPDGLVVESNESNNSASSSVAVEGFPTDTPAPTSTPTFTPTSTASMTATAAPTATNTHTPTFTPTPTFTTGPAPSATRTPTFIFVPFTLTPAPALATQTPTATSTPAPSSTGAPTAVFTLTPGIAPAAPVTAAASPTRAASPTATLRPGPTATPSRTPTATPFATFTSVPTATPAYVDPAVAGSIGGLVWMDFNADGTRQGGELAAISGAGIQLFSDPNGDGDLSDGVLLAAGVTGGDGTYFFPSLAPGNYLVVENDLPGMVSTTSNRVRVTLLAGSFETVNFGDLEITLPSLPSGGAEIAGRVLNDLNASSTLNSGEPPIGGVTVRLYDGSGALIAQAVTSIDGLFRFPNLAPGAYRVVETDLSGFSSTTLNSVNVFLAAGQTAGVDFLDTPARRAVVIDPAVAAVCSPTESIPGDMVACTITTGNNGTSSAENVVLTLTSPEYMDVVSVLVDYAGGSFLVPVTGGTITLPLGLLAPDATFTIRVLGRVKEIEGDHSVDFRARVSSTSDPDLDHPANNFKSVRINMRRQPVSDADGLPKTGFEPSSTVLSERVEGMVYGQTGLNLEIPALKIGMPIVEVPFLGENWNISWLGNRAGHLSGTANPTFSGNSVISGHVSLAGGKPAPFARLNELSAGNEVVVRSGGSTFIYQVSSVGQVAPDDLSIMERKQGAWLTLLTCADYDPILRTYKSRLVVRAVLVRVEGSR